MNKNYLTILTTAMAAAKTIGDTSFGASVKSGKSVVSLESAKLGGDATMSHEIQSFQNDFKSDLKDKGITLSDAQLLAGERAMIAGMNPKVSLENAKAIAADYKGNAQFHVDVTDPSMHVSVEAFDGSKLSSVAYYSAAFNMMAAKQDDFGELFFPTVVVEAGKSSAKVQATIYSLMGKLTRDGSGAASKMNKIPLLKSLRTGDLTDESNKAYPVVKTGDAATSSVLVESLKYGISIDGVTTNVAPIKPSVEVDLISLATTAAQLNSGTPDHTYALSKKLGLGQVFYTFSNGTVTDVISFNVANLLNTNFTETAQGHAKDLVLSARGLRTTVKIGTTADVDGDAATVFDAVGAGYTATFEIELAGAANAETGNVVVSPVAKGIKIVSLRDAAGQLVATSDGKYTALAGIVNHANTAFTGWMPDAYLTNTNLSNIGKILSTDSISVDYAIPFRDPISIVGSLLKDGSDESDATVINGQANAAGYFMSQFAVETLTNFAGVLKELAASQMTLAEANFNIVTKDVLDAYYDEDTIDVSAAINSKRSGERDEDIASAIIYRVKAFAAAAYGASGLAALSKEVNGTEEVELIIGTDAKVASFIAPYIDKLVVPGKWTVSIATTANNRVSGKLYASFRSKVRNAAEANVTNFGNMLWRPELNARYTKGGNNTITENNTVVPSYIHIVNLPILLVLGISNIEEATGRITNA